MPASPTQELKELGIGYKINTLRTAKGLSLEELAEKLNLSASLLAQIEEEVVPPTVATLLNAAKYFGLNIDHFFTEVEDSGKIEVTRVNERLTVYHESMPDRPGLSYNYESLAYRLAKKHMEPFMVEFDSRQPAGDSWSHDGEEFIFILEGEIDFISGDEHLRLSAGDSLYFYANIPHYIRGIGAKKAKAIIVLYPYAS